MKEIDEKSTKLLRNDTRLEQALTPTNGWNPITYDNRVARFRCVNCGTLQGIGTRDMQGEFEHRCPVCGLGMVFNRKQHKKPAIHNEALQRMMLEALGNV